jgi:transcriptional regulator with XRE-family HTH domain/tetratricopeptide (TPR) repeat protein
MHAEESMRGDNMDGHRLSLAAAREQKHWTQEDAAERFGVAVQTIWRWESGQSFPRAHFLRQICEEYGMSAEELGLVRDTKDSQKAQKRAPVIQAQVQAPSPLFDAPDVVGKSYAAFRATNAILHFLHIIQSWPVHTARYHDLQAVIALEVEDNSMMQEPLNRREALRALAGLSIELCSLSALMPVLKHPVEEILPRIAAGITACWYLRRGKDLTFASEMVSAYIPTLQEIVRIASEEPQRKAAADLAAQSLLLKATLVRHVDGSNAAAIYAQQAENYGEVAENRLLQILALRTQAAIYDYGNLHEQALRVAQKAKYLLEMSNDPSIPPLAHSYVYAGLATYQGYLGKKQDALTSLKKAHATFFAQSHAEPVPIWIDHGETNLILNDGLTYYYLDMHKEALDTFAQAETKKKQDLTSYAEILLSEVLAEVSRSDKPRDMEFCIDHWTQGIEEAKTLQSNQRFNEAIHMHTVMSAIWPGEKRIKELRDLIVHW